MDISVSISEALRYAGKKKTSECDASTLSKFDRFAKEVLSDAQPAFSALSFDIEVSDSAVILSTGDALISASLAKHLSACKKAIVFSATLGVEVDRRTRRLGITSMEDALIYDACATALVEDYCDKICASLQSKYGRMTSRFSPGYGDLKIDTQPLFLSLTDASRRAGINMNSSFLLSPMKSVTAIAGIYESEKLQ